MSDGSGSAVEVAKVASAQLRGAIARQLREPTARFVGDDPLTLKFHGIYQQDNRDLRAARTRAGQELDSICMVRVSIPGGALTAEQYLALDRLAGVVADGTLRITTRQGIQFHFVRKHSLAELIATLNSHLLTTLGACGDVSRNVTCCPAPYADGHHRSLAAWAQVVARHFRPRTLAYYEIWIDGDRAVSAEVEDQTAVEAEEPFYGTAYLPRKLKFGFAAADENCIDVLANDVAVVPHLEGGSISAFTILVGGGMGKSHNSPTTFPQLAQPVTTVRPDELIGVLAAVAQLHRDHCDRQDRSHARLKYLVAEWGVERVRKQLEHMLDRTLDLPRALSFDHADSHLGWHPQGDSRWFVGVKVANGRIADSADAWVRTALRAVVECFAPSIRFTTREDVLLGDIHPHDRLAVDALLRRHGVVPINEWQAITRHSFACPALPTCGLALAESERALPSILAELHQLLVSLGLEDLDAHVRMTGCPNGCARPYTSEIGIVGRGKDRYDLHLGGDIGGMRLNGIFCENVPRRSIIEVLQPVLARYAAEHRGGERFGDFCDRVGVQRLRREEGTEQWVRVKQPPS